MKSLLRKTGFFTAFIIPGLVVTGFYIGGSGNFLAILFSFLILPAIDQFCGIDTSNVSEKEIKTVADDFFYRFVTYIWTFFQLACFLWAIYAVTGGALDTMLEWFAFTLSFSLITGGIGITVAHELGHKKSRLEKFYSKLLLMTVSYMHFYIEHNRGHHVYVATPLDPATAKRNEGFYAFWMRSVFGGYAHAWRLEKKRLERDGKPWFHYSNEMFRFAFFPILFCAALTIAGSFFRDRFVYEVPLFFFAQSFFAFTLLELVNYVEHYGITRREVSPGRYERVNPLHSWNASHMLSNFFLFQLQRHSDHHAYAFKRYQVLNHYDGSPQLPYGYPTMILLALLPPLWFSMMNKRLDHWREVQFSVSPS